MAPFGVRVVVVVTGGVRSRIARTVRYLPEGSAYEPIKEDYRRRLTHSQRVGMDADVYARSVVGQLVGSWPGPPDMIWEGNMSWLIWSAETFLPAWVLAWILSWMFRLGALVDSQQRLQKET